MEKPLNMQPICCVHDPDWDSAYRTGQSVLGTEAQHGHSPSWAVDSQAAQPVWHLYT